MPESAINTIEATRSATPAAPGEVPDVVRRRYLTERAANDTIAYFVDARVETPAFRDHGRRLSTERNDPNVIRDLVAVAVHRGWTEIDVRGQTDFRREAWMAARRAGLEVRGYRPTDRDQQELARRGRSSAQVPDQVARPDAMKVVETVVRNRIVDAAEQSRILAVARERLARWLERGADLERGQTRQGPAR